MNFRASAASPLRPRRTNEGRQDGISLVELLVSMFIVSLLGVIVAGMFISATRSVASAGRIDTDTGTAANMLNEISRAVRSATPSQVAGATVAAVSVAQPETLVLYSFIDTDDLIMRPIKIQFAVNATSRQIVETRWLARDAGSGTWKFDLPLTVSSTKVLPGTVVAPSASYPDSLFTYLRADNTTITNPSSELANIVAIKIKVVERPSLGSAAVPVILSNEVGLPNLGISRTGTPQP